MLYPKADSRFVGLFGEVEYEVADLEPSDPKSAKVDVYLLDDNKCSLHINLGGSGSIILQLSHTDLVAGLRFLHDCQFAARLLRL